MKVGVEHSDSENVTGSEKRLLMYISNGAASSSSICSDLNTSYSYAIKLLQSLQRKGYIKKVGSLKSPKYTLTGRFPAFMADIDKLAIPGLFLEYKGQSYPIPTAILKLRETTSNSNFLHELSRVIATLWARSYAHDINKRRSDASMDEEVLKFFLWRRMLEAQETLKLAKQLFDMDIWKGQSHVWKLIDQDVNNVEKYNESRNLMETRFTKGELNK